MIRTKDLGMDRGSSDLIGDAVRYKKVVDPPSGIVFSGVEAVAPPTIHTGCIGIKVTEGVGKASLQQFSETFPFFVRETGISPVGGRVLQIDFPVGHVKVTAGDDGLFGIQRGEIFPESIIPFQSMIDPCKPLLRIGSVAGDEEKFRVFQCDQPAFGVQFGDPDAVSDGNGFLPGKNSRTGISFFLSVIPILMISGKLQLDLARLEFCFLQTEEVCILAGKIVLKALADTGSETIYIP